MSTTSTVRDRADLECFEMPVGDATAFLVYERDGGTLRLLHTEVPESARGQGAGSRLIGGVLDLVRERGEKVEPLCPAVSAYIDRHPATKDLVAD